MSSGLPISESTPVDGLCERGRRAEEARVERELTAVVLLVRDTVMHPREAGRVHAAELPDRALHPLEAERGQLGLALRQAPAERLERGLGVARVVAGRRV